MRRRFATLFTAAALVASAAPVLLAAPASAASFPPGFIDTTVSGGLDGAIAVAKLPDGRLIVARRGGTVTVLNPDGTNKVDVLGLSVCQLGEQGLLGVTVDPQFATNHFFYLYYTYNAGGACGGQGEGAGGSKNRVSRFTLNGASAAGTELILLDKMPEWPGNNHDGGTVHIAQDGLLYVSVGDGGGGRPASNPTDLAVPNGKILRVNLDGSPAPGNPYGATPCKDNWVVGGPTQCGEIFAIGLRNPFRLGFKADGAAVKFNINDVGQNTWEEVDEGIPAANYGWPEREGPCPTGEQLPCAPAPAGLTDPVLYYNQSTGCRTITGGAFVPDGLWTGYDGSYVFADFGCGDLFVQKPGQSGQTFDTLSADAGSVTDVQFLPENGSYSMYYTVDDQLHRVTGPSQPQPPISGLKFDAVSPTRLLDTRSGLGTGAGKLGPGGAIGIQVTGGVVPATAKAVVLNLTATLADGPGFVSAWPSGQAQPSTSSLNVSEAGETAANAVVVPIGAGGQVTLFSSGGTHLVADVTGYFSDAGSSTDGRFHPTPEPTRLLDTRNGTGGKSGPFGAGESFDLQVGGQGGVPATGVTGVALTVTYTGPTAPGFLTLWPAGEAQPTVSTTNPNGPGDIRSNLALVKLGSAGKVSILSFKQTDVVVDVVGYFAAGSGTNGLFTSISPARIADSRQPSAPFGRLVSGTEVTQDFSNFVSANATGALYNLTATNTVGGGFITAHPAGTPVPTASSVNWSGPDQHRAALTISSLASQRKVGLFDFSDADAIIDLAGWFTG